MRLPDGKCFSSDANADFEDTLTALRAKYPNASVAMTVGADGVLYDGEEGQFQLPAFKVKAVDTTAAGDTFCGSALNYILEHDLQNLSETELAEMLKISNAAAALVTTKKGALKSMPEKEEINYLIH